MTAWWTASLAALLVGAALFARGRWPRRVGDHPHCRRCGFDLFGRPTGSDRCPECGADLARRRAVIVGERPRRWPSRVVGTMLALVGLAVAGTLGHRRAAAVDWTPYKPASWLIADLAVPSRCDVAADELARRVGVGRLSRGRANEAVDSVAAHLRNRTRLLAPTEYRMARLAESAHAAGLVDAPRFAVYLERTVAFRPPHATVRRARHGRDDVAVLEVLADAEVLSAGGVRVTAVGQRHVDGRAVGRALRATAGRNAATGLILLGGTCLLDPPTARDLADRRFTIGLRLRLSAADPAGKTLHEWTLDLDRPDVSIAEPERRVLATP